MTNVISSTENKTKILGFNFLEIKNTNLFKIKTTLKNLTEFLKA